MKYFAVTIFKTDISSKGLISNSQTALSENFRQICIYLGGGKNKATWEYNNQKFYKDENIENFTINNDLKEDTTIIN